MFQSVRNRLMAALLLLVFLPGAVAIGVAYFRSTEIVRDDSIRLVGWTAEQRYERLKFRLTRQKERAQDLLKTITSACLQSRRGNYSMSCVRQSLAVFKGTEEPLGIRLHLDRGGDFFLGSGARQLSPPAYLKKGQVAAIVPRSPGRSSYLISVKDQTGRNTLLLQYDADSLKRIFKGPSPVGKEGRSFLVDHRGFLIGGAQVAGQARQEQPLRGLALQRCLSGESSTALARDLRGQQMIYGFRHVAELGGGCIMAQLDQAIAFAPLVSFQHWVLALVAFFSLAGLFLAYWIARSFSLQFSVPIGRLVDRVRLAEAGDLDTPVQIEGPPEVQTIAKGFSSMKKALKRNIQSREDLLSIVSHDLMNPLSAIILGSAFLRRRFAASPQSVDPVVLSQMRIIEGAANRMRGLVSELLDLGKIQAGTFHLHKEVHDVVKIASEVMEMLQTVAAEKGVRLESRFDSSSDLVECDPGRVFQVFSNLIGNGIKFAPEGGLVLVSRRKESSVDGEVEFVVEDNGPGIPSEQVSRVFDRFWKGKSVKQAGSGLGLYISKAIIEGHGGRIRVESRKGEGTTFSFTLPTNSLTVPGLPLSSGAVSQSAH